MQTTIDASSPPETSSPGIRGTSPRPRRSHAGRTALAVSAMVHGLLFLAASIYIVTERSAQMSAVDFSADLLRLSPDERQPRKRPLRVKHLAARRATTAIPVFNGAPTTVADVPALAGETTLALSAPEPTHLPMTDRTTAIGPSVAAIRPLRALIRSHATTPATPSLRQKLTGSVPTSEAQHLRYEAPKIDFDAAIVASVVRRARFHQRIVPRYPEAARRAGIEGVVVLEATIHPDGRARNILVVQALGLGCDEAAVAALRASRLVPAYQGDQAAASTVRVPYRFRIGDIR